MSYKFFYLFLIGGLVALALLIIEVTTYPDLGVWGVASRLIPAIILLYLAYKVWHEKNDQELM